MRINIYAKLNEKLDVFDGILDIIRQEEDETYITIENKRAFHELEKIKTIAAESIFVISCLESLGLKNLLLDEIKCHFRIIGMNIIKNGFQRKSVLRNL